jgi:hypothetical protein
MQRVIDVMALDCAKGKNIIIQIKKGELLCATLELESCISLEILFSKVNDWKIIGKYLTIYAEQ